MASHWRMTIDAANFNILIGDGLELLCALLLECLGECLVIYAMNFFSFVTP
jgi:hypothetical protein